MSEIDEKIIKNGLKKKWIASQLGITYEFLSLVLKSKYNLNAHKKSQLVNIVNTYDNARRKFKFCF